MKLSRRHAIVGATVALAGCSEMGAEIEERAADVRALGGHPLAGTATISVVDRTDSDYDLRSLAAEAAAYWTEHAVEYADVEASFAIVDDSSDIELVFLGDRADLEGCQEHASEEVLGCAPLLKPGHRPERPITLEVVVSGQSYGDVLVTTKHELGHALGLGHDDDPAHIMSNDIEDRLPEYDRRQAILDSIESAWSNRNSATREYNRAIDRWNDEEYAEAVPKFESSADRYRGSIPFIDTASELEEGFDGMRRPETVDRETLRDQFERAHEWVTLAIERSEQMTESAVDLTEGDGSKAHARWEAAEATFERLQTIEFPAPIDVARALGLVRDRAVSVKK